jgi:hypothetical protein
MLAGRAATATSATTTTTTTTRGFVLTLFAVKTRTRSTVVTT